MRLRTLALFVVLSLVAACDTDGSNSATPGADVVNEDVSETPEPPAPVVFGVISDTHVCGSVEHHVSQNLIAALDELATLEPAPAFVVVTGDLIDSQPGCAQDDGVDPLDTFLSIVDGSPLPVEPVAGNHDYYAEEGPYAFVEEQAVVDDRYLDELGIPAYRAEVVTGVKFIYLNSMNGPLWDLSLGLNGSLGDEQLAWLDEELGEGIPSVLFAHHPPELIDELDGGPTLEDVLAVHEGTALGMFFGHMHIFARGELAGVPYYLTADTQLGNGYHHVRVDPEAGTVEILNEEDIDYGEVETSDCVAGEESPVGDPSAFVGSLQQVVVAGLEAEGGSLAQLLKEGLAEVPLILRIGEFDASGLAFSAELVSGTYLGELDEEAALPRYVEASAGWPCIPIGALFEDPCFETQPTSVMVDIAEILDYELPEGWQARVGLDSLRLQGRLTTDGEPHFADGVLRMEADLSVFANDVKAIAVTQYCGGQAACLPGENGNPECPDDPDASFYDSIPSSCDIDVIEGFTARMLLVLIDSEPSDRVAMVATFETRVPTMSDEAAAGAVATDLFGVCE